MTTSEEAPLAAFAGIRTFAHLPHVAEPQGVDAVVVGVPFDTAVTYRSGGRMGPSAVRAASSTIGSYNPAVGVAPLRDLRVVDGGDVAIVPGNTQRSFEAIARHARQVRESGAVPFFIGGDHSCTLPQLRGVRDAQPLAIIHFDAHADFDDEIFGERYCHGTWLRRAVEEDLVHPAHAIQIGLRGSIGGPEVYAEVERCGLSYLTTDAVRRDIEGTIRAIRERVGNRPTYLTFDLDVVDPAFAPGVGCPEPGGLASWEVIALIRGLTGINLVGFDVVELIPSYDPAELTATLAATLGFELLSQLACHRRGQRG